MTNSGRAASDRLPMVTATSNFVSRRNAVSEPRNSEIGTLSRAAMKTSRKVFSTRRASSLVTGASCTREFPRLPVATLPSQLRYCAAMGRLSPSCSRRAL